MPILVPTVMILVVAVASLAALAAVVWRHHVGTSLDQRLRCYDELPVRSTSTHVNQLAA